MGRLVIAAPHSGASKTTVCLGLLAALSRPGVRVQPFKAGPDFIELGLHQLAAGIVSHNLDTWLLSRTDTLSLFTTCSHGADLALVEGVMGLFDGHGASAGRPSPGGTAEVVVWLDAPVVLVVSAHGQGQSVAALLKSFEGIHPHIGGVIFNRVGSPRRAHLLTRAVVTHCCARVLGSIPRDAAITIPKRRLGLYAADDLPASSSFWECLAQRVTGHLDLTALLMLARTVSVLPPELIVVADLVTETRFVKHLHRDGIQAQKGGRVLNTPLPPRTARPPPREQGRRKKGRTASVVFLTTSGARYGGKGKPVQIRHGPATVSGQSPRG